jgi:AraC family transcriptional regulator of adaptative response/methylated-DNA-[protein]-cysteine methyltransferase
MNAGLDTRAVAPSRAAPLSKDVISCGVRPTSLGWALISASNKGVCAIFFGDEPEPLFDELRARWPKAAYVRGDADFARLADDVAAYIENPAARVPFPLDIRGTDFQRRVWSAMREVPAGATASYSDIARRVGAPRAMRAVGTACGANPIAVVIPCHRILRADGDMSGYRWCVKRKRALLEREAAAARRR